MEKCFSRYDADYRKLRVWSDEIFPVSDDSNLENKSEVLTWKNLVSNRRKYPASNVFGASVIVEEIHKHYFQIAFDNFTQFPLAMSTFDMTTGGTKIVFDWRTRDDELDIAGGIPLLATA